MSKIKTSFTDSQPEYVLSMLSKFWLTLQLPSDQERISPYSVNAILGRQVMRIKKIKKLGDYKLTQYQILQTNITRTVWQTVRRITDEILGVKRLMRSLNHYAILLTELRLNYYLSRPKYTGFYFLHTTPPLPNKFNTIKLPNVHILYYLKGKHSFNHSAWWDTISQNMNSIILFKQIHSCL